jgi:glycosyltransferase involved in cell wall biosynthesis
MRIAIVTESFLPKVDGVVTLLTKTVECLQRAGDEVLILAPHGGPSELHGATVVGLPSFRFPLYRELLLALPRRRMRAILEDFKPDILHIIEPVLLGAGAIYFGAEMGLPTVVSSHTYLPAYVHYYGLGPFEEFIWKLMRLRHKRANLNLCTSSVTINDLRNRGIEDPRLWERAVDSDLFSPGARSVEMRQRLSGGEPEKPLLLYVGRLSAEKEVTKLRDVMRARPEARLAIVGDGPVRGELERHFEGTATVFTGYLRGKELASAYASSDLFVFPSRTETLGLVLLEAMAAGCPVVACRAGGVPDAVQDGATGFLFEPEDAEGLVKAVARALGCKADLDRVREDARREVEQFSWESATDRLREMYLETIEGYAPKISPKGLVQRTLSPATLAVLRTLLP